MKSLFVKHNHGDYVRADHLSLVGPSPEDPMVRDDDPINCALINGFGVIVRCGDLRAALGIKIADPKVQA